jgi:hypothetical protein
MEAQVRTPQTLFVVDEGRFLYNDNTDNLINNGDNSYQQ